LEGNAALNNIPLFNPRYERRYPVKRTLLSLGIVALSAMLVWPVAAQDLASSIVGVWRQTSLIEKDVASGATAPVQKSEEQGGYRVFTRGGHAVILNIYKPRKAPPAANATDADLAALFRTMSAFSGTYKVDGDKLTIRVDASWIEAWNGSDRPFRLEITGNKLTMTAGPVKNAYTGKDILLVSSLERVE
jgi:hypothetical protein